MCFSRAMAMLHVMKSTMLSAMTMLHAIEIHIALLIRWVLG